MNYMISRVLFNLNINHVAVLRYIKRTIYPDPVYAAFIAEQAGVDGISLHLREDRKYITDRDLTLLKKTVQTTMHLKVAAIKNMVDFVCKLKPNYCCLVSERYNECIIESGLDVVNKISELRNLVSKLVDYGIHVSLFINPDQKQVDAAYKVGVSCIELHTGMYSRSIILGLTKNMEYQRINRSIQCAMNHGLQINASYGLNYNNIQFIAMIPEIQKLSVGHAVISRSVFCGLHQAIKDMQEILRVSRKEVNQ